MKEGEEASPASRRTTLTPFYKSDMLKKKKKALSINAIPHAKTTTVPNFKNHLWLEKSQSLFIRMNVTRVGCESLVEGKLRVAEFLHKIQGTFGVKPGACFFPSL